MLNRDKSDFERRFDQVVVKSRLTRVATALGWVAFVLCACLIAMACADYVLELHWKIRVAFIALASLLGVVVSVRFVVGAFRDCSRDSTAARLEERFEDLGQSVRTSVALDTSSAETQGISPSLLAALNENVRERTRELRLTDAISTVSLKWAGSLLAVALIVVATACAASWQWRTAAYRALSIDTPYTIVEVDLGDVRVKKNDELRLIANISGRTDREVSLLTREIGSSDIDWQVRPITSTERLSQQVRQASYGVSISKIDKPFEYCVVADTYASQVHTVDVQYPLTIEKFETEIHSPSYTGLAPRIVQTGNFEVVQGSVSHVNLELNQPADEAWLELRPIVSRLGEDPKIETVPLAIDGRRLSAELALDQGQMYRVYASAADGTVLRPNRFRIRVNEDRPPRVAFKTLGPTTKVHSLAELVLQLSVADDYGLKRAGIVFQLNNEPEFVLEGVDFEDIVRADGTLSPRTKELVTTMLELEYFEMTEKDSISYFGFAEDKRPDQTNINETDLRFIDIVPFRRLIGRPPPAGSQGLRGLGRRNQNNARQLPALNSLISRERFILNRSLQMERSDRRGKNIGVAALDGLVKSQNQTSESSGRLGDRATDIEIRFGIPEEGRISDLLYQARDAMLRSVDSLNNVEFEVATLQERDALTYLTEARERIDIQLRARRNASFRRALAALVGATQNMSSRTGRPRPKNNKARVDEIVLRLRAAAVRQDKLLDQYAAVVAVENDDDNSAAWQRIRKGQSDLETEIQDVAELIEQVESFSELVKQRAEQAATTAAGINNALQQGNTPLAMELATDASSAYRILVSNIIGISARDAARRLGTARDLGVQLANALRTQTLRVIETDERLRDPDTKTTEEQSVEIARGLSRAANWNAEIAKTVADVLESVIDLENGIADQEDQIVRRLTHLMEENRLDETIDRLAPLAEMITGQQWTDVAAQSADIADRIDIVTQRLDAMQREILSPRIERLRQLAKRTAEAKDELRELLTEDQIDRWHLRTDGLIFDIEESDVATPQVELVREAMDAAEAAATSGGWGWPMNDAGDAFLPPPEYTDSLSSVIDEIERNIRELLAADKQMAMGGAVPPEYKNLVGVYLQLLSGEASTRQPSDR